MRPQLLQLFIDRRQTDVRAGARTGPLGRALQRAILIHQRFQIDTLLFGRIQRIFFRLQLRLQASQNLQIAADLGRQFADVLPFELANLFFLVR